jgi:hypothetical protein
LSICVDKEEQVGLIELLIVTVTVTDETGGKKYSSAS